MALKQVTLWSWLTKSETKEEFRCPPGLRVTNRELVVELIRQVRANKLPAQIELCEVNWDDSDTKQTRAMVRYTGPDAKTNVVRMLVGVDQMGNFAYVERKIYLRPPQLPQVPRMKKEQAPWSGPLLGIAVLVGLGGVFGLLSYNFGLGVIGLLLCILFAVIGNRSRKTTIAWNVEAEQETAAWDGAWSSWRKEVVQAAYLSRTDDVFGRFTLAISSTVDDVIKTLFTDRDAELRRRTEHEQTQEAIEKELERRRAEAFA